MREFSLPPCSGFKLRLICEMGARGKPARYSSALCIKVFPILCKFTRKVVGFAEVGEAAKVFEKMQGTVCEGPIGALSCVKRKLRLRLGSPF